MADLLILCVSHHSVLYDRDHKDYRNNELKDDVWSSIAQQLGYRDYVQAKRLWKNLRDTYVRKRKEGKEKSGQNGKQKKRWRYMEAMSFLEDTAFREVHSNLDRLEQDEEHDEKQEAVEQHSDYSEGEMTATAAPNSKAPKRKNRDYLEQYLERKEAREKQRAKEREERDSDEIHLFLMSLAPVMRRLPADRQSWLKIKMQELVHEAQFGPSQVQMGVGMSQEHHRCQLEGLCLERNCQIYLHHCCSCNFPCVQPKTSSRHKLEPGEPEGKCPCKCNNANQN